MQPITKKLTTFIWYFVKPFRWHFFVMASFRIVSAALDTVAVNHVIKLLTDRFETLAKDVNNIWVEVGGYFLTFLLVLSFIELLSRLFDYMKVKIIPKFEANIRMWIVQYLQGHPYRFFTEHFSGDLVKRIDDLTDGVSQVVIMLIASFWPSFCTILAGICYFFYIQPLFGVILVAWFILHIIAYMVYARKYNHYMMLHAEKVSLLCGRMVDGFANILSIKLFSCSSHSVDHLRMSQIAEKQTHKKALKVVTHFHCIISVLFVFFMGIGLPCTIIYYWQLGKLTLSDVFCVFTTGMNIWNCIWLSVGYFPDFFEEVGYCKQALQLLLHPYAIVDLPRAATLRCQSATICFKGVFFSYKPDVPFFENQNVSIDSGEKVGLVGLSGSGKTTFVHLLLRFYDPQKGIIAINGQNIATVTQESLRAAIALIPQDTLLFNESILENIRYGRREATEQEVLAAAQQAKCHDFIVRLPDGYNTLVGERGSQLSGGQRQRIAIARAILKNAPILILDEATSALDVVTETEIQESLATVMVNKTTIVIAHRLSVLASMDRILLFDKGKIVAQGSHAQLVEISPLYKAMCNLT